MKTAHDIIIRPIISEQSMDQLAEKKYTFEVKKSANKIEIKKAIESVLSQTFSDFSLLFQDGRTRPLFYKLRIQF